MRQMICKVSSILIIKFNYSNLPSVIDNLYGLLLFLLRFFLVHLLDFLFIKDCVLLLTQDYSHGDILEVTSSQPKPIRISGMLAKRRKG